MTARKSSRNPLLQTILEWANAQTVQQSSSHLANIWDGQKPELLAALGGLAKAVFDTDGARGCVVPIEVSNWWNGSPTPPEELAEGARRALQSGRDLFGELYTAISTTTHRRKLGTVFTPPAIAAHMLALCGHQGVEPSTVIDPGAGVGIFTLQAASKWKVPVIAVDINVITLGFLAAHCSLAGYNTYVGPLAGDHETDRTALSGINLVRSDFLTWLPTGLSRAIGPALIVGNPPYTRHQDIDSEVKESARDIAGPLISSGMAGMAAYFLGASLRFLRPQDALCMILPGSWMQASYGREIRKHLWSLTHRCVQINIFPHKGEVFPRTKVDAVVLFVGPEEKQPCLMTVNEVLVNHDQILASNSLNVNRSGETLRAFPRTIGDWAGSNNCTPRLKESFAVHRGIATGHNRFFLLNDKEVENHRIPSSVLVPVVSSLKKLEEDVIDDTTFGFLQTKGVKRWLLLLAPDDGNLAAIQRYIMKGHSGGVPKRYLAKQRRQWFVLEDSPPAPLLLLPMTKSNFRVIENIKGVRHTNNLYGLYPLNKDIDVKRSISWLRSDDGQQALRKVARRYGDGMFKLEPLEVGNVEVPPWFGCA